MIFSDYANYYDLLYKDKNYEKEIDYIDTLIKKNVKGDNLKILDIGCGTGIHAKYLASKGYHVTGIDISEEMIQIAKNDQNKNTEFYVYDAKTFKLTQKFDIILSLFHVVSYQTTNRNLSELINNVSCHLKDEGLFIFDFWYGPAVLTDRPQIRIKRFSDDKVNIVRLAEPVMSINENIVDVNYELIIYSKDKNYPQYVNETHKMRYFFLPEINFYLQNCKMEALNFEEWLTSQEPSDKTWSVCCIAHCIEN